MRVAIRVHPAARRPSVGGDYDGALTVRVGAPAVDGKATAAALTALAKALDVPARDVHLVSGATNRTKIVDIPDAAISRFESLRLESAD